MGKVLKTEEEEGNNAPVVDVEAETAIRSGGGRSDNWGEENTSRSDSSDYEQGYLGVVHYVNDTAIVGTASSNTLSGFRTERVPQIPTTPICQARYQWCQFFRATIYAKETAVLPLLSWQLSTII
jgi:hypothetical protein